MSVFLSIVVCFTFIGPISVNAETESDEEVNFDGYVASFDANVSNKEIKKELNTIGNVEKTVVSGDTKVVLIDIDVNETKAEKVLENSDLVDEFNPNYEYESFEEDPYVKYSTDTSYQYYLDNIDVFSAWDYIYSVEHGKTRIGVIDTGVDSWHEDLQELLVVSGEERLYRQFSHGEINDVNTDSDTESYHGTHVTGIIGATYGNGKGGAGVASGYNNDLVDVLPVCASPNGKSLYTYDICKSIGYAVDNGCSVINMSFGNSKRDKVMESLINDYYKSGVVFVAASGNSGTDAPSYPSDFDSVISVNAVNSSGNYISWSNYGYHKDISAPGYRIQSTLGHDCYGILSGTSMASPVIASVVGLMKDVNPDLSPEQVKNILYGTASNKGSFSMDLAYGVVDAYDAVKTSDEASVKIGPKEVKIKESYSMKNGSYNFKIGDTVHLEALVSPASSLTDVVWSSSNTSVCDVDSFGNLIAKGLGKATIKAKAGSVVDSITVVVQPLADIEYLCITNLPEGNMFSTVDKPGKFKVDSKPSVDIGKFCCFSSSDNDILSVNTDGSYVVKKAGTIVLTVREVLTGAEIEEVIHVRNDIQKVSFVNKVSYLRLGQSYNFLASPEGLDLYKPDVKYSCSNSNGVIDKMTGYFTAKKVGSCYVVAKVANGKSSRVKLNILKKTYSGKDYKFKAKKTGKKVVKLSWKAQPLARSYVLEKKVGKNWKVLKKTSGLNYVDKKFKKTCSYRVRAIYHENGKTKKYGYSTVIKIKKMK